MAGHRARSPSEKGVRVKKKKTKTPEQLTESQLPPFLTAMHHNVIALLGYDVADSMWYGVSKDGRAVVKSSSHSSKFIGAALSDWDAAKVKPTTILADMIENDLAITSATLTPRARHQVGRSDCFVLLYYREIAVPATRISSTTFILQITSYCPHYEFCDIR